MKAVPLVAVVTFGLCLPISAQDQLDSLLSGQRTEPQTEDTETNPDGKETHDSGVMPASQEDGTVAPERRLVEEIVVTAQKREQVIQDVPISMAVVDDQFISEQGLTDFKQLSRFVPNVFIESSGFFIAPRIRGFSVQNINKGFESSVGLAIDGIPYSPPPYFQAAFLDLERIEVLRGPQGTTFGKNTTAGLLNVVTKSPTDSFTGFADLQLGVRDRQRIEAGLGGPLVPNVLNFRVAGFVDEVTGFLRNTTADVVPGAIRHLNGNDHQAFRIKLQAPDVMGSTFDLSYEHFDLHFIGDTQEMFRFPDSTRSLMLRFDPNTDFTFGNGITSADFPDTGRKSRIDTIVGHWGYDLGAWSLKALAGHSLLHSTSRTDADRTPVPALFFLTGDDNLTTTAELQVYSPLLGGFFGLDRLFDFALGDTEFLAGFFFQQRRIEDSTATLGFGLAEYGELTGLARAENAGLPASPVLPEPPVGETGVTEESTLFFEQTADTIAGFGEFNWHFLPDWGLQVGTRLSNETKEAAWNRVFDTPTNTLFTAIAWDEFTTSRDRSEFQVQSKVSLNYEPIENVSLFASWGNGFKGGGFNEFASGNSDQELLFEPESVTQWELNAKTRWLGGAATFNLALFRMDVDDFQVFTTDPDTLVITIENAAKARSQGVEGDFTWVPIDWVTFRGAVGFNDTEFLSFPNNQCPNDQPNTDGDDDPRCDATGKPLEHAPKWMINLTTSVGYPLASLLPFSSVLLDATDVTGSLNAEYVDVHFLDIPLTQRQDSFFRLNGTLGLASLSSGWSIRLVGENLTDELTSLFHTGTAGVPGLDTRIVNPPRTIFGQLRYEF